MAGPSTERPPQVQLAVRVGVTGHRDLSASDPKELRARIRDSLRAVKDAALSLVAEPDSGYAPTEPVCRLLTALAEGADRLVAEEALELGFELQCPLPFPVAEYRKDFATVGIAAVVGRAEGLKRVTAVCQLPAAPCAAASR